VAAAFPSTAGFSKSPMIDSRSFRQLMGCFATGITVVTTKDANDEAVGLTVNSLTSVSLTPPLVLFCLDRQAKLYPVFKRSTHFGVSILSDDQEDISRHFADAHHNPRPKGLWDKSQANCPIIRQTLGWIACKKSATHKAGDHDIFIGEVVKLRKRADLCDPLLYFHGRYRRIGDA